MKFTSKCSWAMAFYALFVGRACAVTLTFEGLQNFEGVANYYNGGVGSLGSGPGPNYGITFDSNSLAYIPGKQSGTVTPYPGDPSPPTVLLLFNPSNPNGAGFPITTTMDVAGGFTQALSFYYINISTSTTLDTEVGIYSGLDGTGNLLAEEDLATTPAAFGGPTIVTFTGTAYSAVFAGGNDQLALDNISLQAPVPIPEPSTMVLAVSSLPFMLFVWCKVNPFRRALPEICKPSSTPGRRSRRRSAAASWRW
jgi:hypothetical protein